MKDNIIEIGGIVAGIILIILVLKCVFGFAEYTENNFVFSEMHFWDEICEKEISVPVIAPVCRVICGTCGSEYSINQSEGYVSILEPSGGFTIENCTFVIDPNIDPNTLHIKIEGMKIAGE